MNIFADISAIKQATNLTTSGYAVVNIPGGRCQN